MKTLLIALSILSSVLCASLAQAAVSPEQALSESFAFLANRDGGAYSMELNDLRNAKALPSLSAGASFDFGTIVTLTTVGCSESNSTFVCNYVLQYCFGHEGRTPVADTVIIRGNTPFAITQITASQAQLPDSVCGE